MSLDFTSDGFLGGRLTIAQPKTGFRAGHDAVLLAAAVPAKPGERVLELGSGSGVASLCLAARVPGLSVRGIELEPELVELANKNAERNGVADRVFFAQGDTTRLEESGRSFDHVFFNPPFHPDTGQVSPIKARDQARRDQGDAVARWMLAALEATRTGGTVTAILRADRKDDVAEVVRGRGVTIFSLFPHAGEAPKRVLVRIVKGSDEPVRTAAGLVLHLADGKPTPEADAVLRHAAALSLA